MIGALSLILTDFIEAVTVSQHWHYSRDSERYLQKSVRRTELITMCCTVLGHSDFRPTTAHSQR